MPLNDDMLEAAFGVAQQRALTEKSSIQTRLKISESMGMIQDAGQSELDAVDSWQDANYTIKSETNAMSARVDAANAKASLDLGTDSTKSNYRLSKLADDRETNYKNALEAEQIVFNKKQATFASDPLGWINAQITLPADVDVYNHFAFRHNAAETEYNETVQSTSATAVMNNAVRATTSAAMADASLKLVASAADKERAGVQAKFAQFNISGAQALQGLSQQDLSNAHSKLTEQESIQNFALRQEQMKASMAARAESNSRRALTDEQRSALGDAKLDIIHDQQQTLAYYNAAAEKLGGGEFDLPTVMGMLRNKATSEQANNIVRYGQEVSMADSAGQGTDGIPLLALGRTAADLPSIARMVRSKPQSIDKDVYEFSASAINEYTLSKGALLPKDPAIRNAEINKFVQDKAILDYSAIQDGKPNIYSAPTPKQLAESIPIMTQYPAIADVIKRSTDNPDVPIKDKDIINAAKQALAKNPSKGNFENIANSLEAYYVGVTKFNNVHKQFLEKGLPQQEAYNAMLPTGIFGRTQSVNLREPLEIRKILARTLAEANLKAMPAAPFNPPGILE